jgi:hypothetical protein
LQLTVSAGESCTKRLQDGGISAMQERAAFPILMPIALDCAGGDFAESDRRGE